MTLGGAKPPALSPDDELKTLALTKRRLWGYLWLLQLAIMFSCFAFGRIVADTSWDVYRGTSSITASLAAVCWIAFFVSLIRIRARVLIVALTGGYRTGSSLGDTETPLQETPLEGVAGKADGR